MKKELAALTISHLTVAYNHQPVLSDITASIPQGTTCGIVGPNGAGKTTLIKAVVGLIKPIAGVINVLGGHYADHRNDIAYVPQRADVDWDFPATVFDIALMGRYGHCGWFARPKKYDKDITLHALATVGMYAHKDTPIGELSGGQQQRVFLARALAHDPQLYIMDEPFVGVDAVTEKTIVRLLHQLRAQGKTVIIVHHDLSTLHDYFDWLLLLNKKLIACGPTHTVAREHIQQAYCL